MVVEDCRSAVVVVVVESVKITARLAMVSHWPCNTHAHSDNGGNIIFLFVHIDFSLREWGDKFT